MWFGQPLPGAPGPKGWGPHCLGGPNASLGACWWRGWACTRVGCLLQGGAFAVSESVLKSVEGGGPACPGACSCSFGGPHGLFAPCHECGSRPPPFQPPWYMQVHAPCPPTPHLACWQGTSGGLWRCRGLEPVRTTAKFGFPLKNWPGYVPPTLAPSPPAGPWYRLPYLHHQVQPPCTSQWALQALQAAKSHEPGL